MTYRRILCPIDFEQDAQPTLAVAVKLARESRGKIYLVHVLPVPAPMMYPVQSVLESDWRWAEKKLQKIAAQIPAGIDREIVIKFGRTAEEVAKAAGAADADLIVMGTHGYRGIAHVLRGSVAERVVRAAHCPVLTVPLKKAPETLDRASEAA